MPETDSVGAFVTANECRLATKHLHDKLSDIEKDVEVNKNTGTKILSILQGNGEGGIIWKVNSLMLRNVWVDKGVNIVIGIGASLITLYLTGVLHL